jgi:hypothetical protein
MAIGLLIICVWKGVHKDETEIRLPSWPEVEAAIRALDNYNLNDVYLQPHETNSETYLAIGGGGGGYIATGSVDNERFPTLVDPQRPSEPKVLLVVGGQEGDYPANWIIDLPTALRAARSFYDAGGFACDMNWTDV